MQPNQSEAERRIEEARRTQAEWLDLGDLALSELPASLGGLPSLKVLYLGRVGPNEAGQLEWFGDRESPEFTDLSPLAGLQELQSINLDSCEGVVDLSPLAGLRGIQDLHLSETGATNLTPLAGLSDLQSLCLSFTAMTDLSPLASLQSLLILELWGVGVTDLSPLTNLKGLRRLDLSDTGVTDLSPLAGLPNLQRLYLSFTGVTDLSPLASLQSIQDLHLQDCQGVTDLAPLAGLQDLQRLDLFGCRPAVQEDLLRVLAEHPCLNELTADKAVGVPQEVLSHAPFDNCLPRVRSYLSELNFGIEAENEMKVILLGNGRVGKTQLCRRFRRQPFNKSVPSTHGVQIWREELRIQTGDEEQVFQVNWWDFGGQDIYHGTHALFLRSRAVFLILWTPELENREESEENGIPLRNQPLAYWLDYVRSLAGEGSPVIVVQSQCDRFADRRPSPSKPDGLGFYESCSYSAKTDLGRDSLEAHLRDAILSLLERNGTLSIGRGRAELRRRLYHWRSEDQKLKPEERRHRTPTLDEFRALCDEVGGITSWEHALDYFHHTGVVFYRPDLFSNRIVLDQTWALDAIYTVFHRGRAAPWLRDSGRFTREDLALMVWQEHSIEEQRLFLALMESCGVCFRCGETARREPRYVAPDLLPEFETVAGRLHVWKEEAGTPTLRLEYRFVHPAVIRGLMSEIGREAGDMAEYWKYGLWFKDGRRDSQLLVQVVETSTEKMPGAGAVELKAQGRDPLGLLREIRRAILWQRIREKPEELLTLASTTVARSALNSVIDGRVLDLQGIPGSAAAFSAFFAGRDHDPGEALVAREAPVIDIAPQRLTAIEKPPEVFISYAWGDKTAKGKKRAEVVEKLVAALNDDGFLPVRDRDQIRSGELISAFIRRLTRADLVVAVISDKYLRSPYCMYEIYKLWQRFQGEPAELAQCLVPIVLPEVKVGELEDRAPYLKYWLNRKKELEILARELENLSPKSVAEIRLVQEFAHHVDEILHFLKDVLMPRSLEVHFADGFEAVRDALRRRVAVQEKPLS